MMRWLRQICALAGLLVPVPVLAQSVAPERVADFVDVIVQNGCRMGIYRADEVLPGAGFADNDETKTITEILIADGRARILEGQLVVFGGTCGAGSDYSGRERFFAGLADNGCAMTTKQSDIILPRVGVELQEIRLLMDRMIRDGEVTLSADEATVTLSGKVCREYAGLSAVMAASLPPKPEPRDPGKIREEFLAYMATVECSLTRSEAQNKLARAGFAAKDVRPVIKALIDAGEAEMGGEDDRLTISAELCQ